MKHYSLTGRRNHGRPLKRLLDMWDRNGSTSDTIPWQILWWIWFPLIRTHHIKVSKDVRIGGYFWKLRGSANKKKMGKNLLETLREQNTPNEKSALQIHHH
jgi:hypothetical protein